MTDHPLVKLLELWNESVFVRINLLLAVVGFLFLLWS